MAASQKNNSNLAYKLKVLSTFLLISIFFLVPLKAGIDDDDNSGQRSTRRAVPASNSFGNLLDYAEEMTDVYIYPSSEGSFQLTNLFVPVYVKEKDAYYFYVAQSWNLDPQGRMDIGGYRITTWFNDANQMRGRVIQATPDTTIGSVTESTSESQSWSVGVNIGFFGDTVTGGASASMSWGVSNSHSFSSPSVKTYKHAPLAGSQSAVGWDYTIDKDSPVKSASFSPYHQWLWSVPKSKALQYAPNGLNMSTQLKIFCKSSKDDLLSSAPACAVYNNILYCLYRDGDRDADGLMYITTSDRFIWSDHQHITDCTLNYSPSLAIFNEKLYGAYTNTNADILCPFWDGSNWNRNNTNCQSNASPSIASFQGKLYLAFKSNDSSNKIKWKSSNNGQDWSSESDLGGGISTAGPALVSFQEILYCFFKGSSDNKNNSDARIYYETYDGTKWTTHNYIKWGQEESTAIRTTLTPGVVVHEDITGTKRLYLAYQGENDRNIWSTSTTDGISWESPTQITDSRWDVDCISSPSLCSFNNRLYFAHRDSNNKFNFFSMDDHRWTIPLPPLPKLVAVYSDDQNNVCKISSLDGLTWGQPTQISNGVSQSIALARFINTEKKKREKVFLAYIAGDGSIKTSSSYNGETWTTPEERPNMTTWATWGGPSLMQFKDKLFLAVHKSTNTNPTGEIWYTANTVKIDDDDNLTDNWRATWIKLPTNSTSMGFPFLFASNNNLFCGYIVKHDNEFQLRFKVTTDGANWSPQEYTIPNAYSGSTPSFALFKGDLYCAYQPTNTGEVWYTSTANGNEWTANRKIFNIGISGSPSLSVFKGKLYCAYQGSGIDKKLWYTSTENGVDWSLDLDSSKQITLPNNLVGSPALLGFIKRN